MKRSPLMLAALAGLIGVAVVTAYQPARKTAPADAEPASKQPSNLQRTLEMFRSDLNAAKIATLNRAMKLTAPEAEKFWPIYQRYEKDLAAVGERKLALFAEFFRQQHTGGLTDKTSDEIADKWLGVTQDRLELWKKYHAEIGKAVSPVRAAQFLQVEHQIALLIDINIASEMPLVGQPR